MLKAFENNEVLLWGENKVSKKMLDEYDHGNKNPHSLSRRKKPIAEAVVEKKPKIQIKREFSIDEDYGIDDLDFLNKEYERIDKLISSNNNYKETEKLEDLQEKLYDIIEELDQLKKVSGKGIKKVVEEVIKVGKGFKKGSPEAIAHALKMRESKNKSIEEKVLDKKPVLSKSRIEKGSEKAKEIGQRLAEARKKKKEEIKEEPIKKVSGKPWYYIGSIPKGYREATEDEAIKAKKISYYGKYIVDSQKWTLYKEYEILLTDKKNNNEIIWSMNGLKKRTINSLKEIEILSSKIENDKNKDKKNEIENKLSDEKIKRKFLQAGYNWYYKLLCERLNKPYTRQKIELEEKEIKQSEKEEKQLVPVEQYKEIDPRTGKVAETYLDDVMDKTDKLLFSRGDEVISLNKKYFVNNKLTSKYAQKLYDKNIILEKEFYEPKDYKKFIYVIHDNITGGKISTSDLSGLLKASYNKKINNVGGFVKDDKLSSKTSKVYHNKDTGQTVVAHRGTSGFTDWLNNAVYAVGGESPYKMTPRYKEASKVQKRAESKYGSDNVSTIGHSQGGLQAEMLGKKSHEIITLNKATRPFGTVSGKNQYDISSDKDLISSFNPFHHLNKKGNEIIVPSKSSNIINEHKINILNRLEKDKMIGKGNIKI